MPQQQQSKDERIKKKLRSSMSHYIDTLRELDSHEDITTMNVHYTVDLGRHGKEATIREIKLFVGQNPRTELHLYKECVQMFDSGRSFRRSVTSEHVTDMFQRLTTRYEAGTPENFNH
jgi:hypothetical protein